MGKTLLSLFDSFSKEELCQLYIYPSMPNVDKCNSYYRITDNDVLKNIVKFGKPGEVIRVSPAENVNVSSIDQEHYSEIYSDKRNSNPFRRILRDAMWKMSNWNNKSLKAWIQKEKPDCIFLAPGYAKFIYDIALKLSEEFNLPIVTYICDDYYFVKTPKKLVGKVQLTLLKKKIEQLFRYSKQVVAICDEIKNLYQKQFEISATTIMTGASIEIAHEPRICRNPKSISYFGNVGCNRYKSLIELGLALDEINSETGEDLKIKVYTSENSEEIINALKIAKSIELMGFVSGQDYEAAFFSSEILLHVEAFDKESIDIVKHSVSTKIADCLASGIPLIAYGPEEVASIAHLERNKCAYIINADIKKQLESLFINKEYKETVLINSLGIANLFHDRKACSNRLKSILKGYNE